MFVYVGADWSAKACVLVAGEGKQEWRTRCEPPSEEAVHQLLDRIRARFGVPEVRVVIEAGCPVWIRLFHAAGAVVYVMDPKQTKKFGESCRSSGAKDDRNDARNLRDMGMSDRHRPEPWTPTAETGERLTRLCAHRERHMQNRVREIQRIRDELRLSMPLIERCIKDFEAKWVQRLVKGAPTAWHVAKAGEAGLRKLLAGARDTTVTEVLEAARLTSAPWLTAKVAMDSARYVKGALRRIAELDKDIAAVDRAIDSILESAAVAQKIQSIKGLGRQLTTALIAFGMVGVDPTESRDAVSIRMGSSPVFVGSAETAAGKPKGITLMRRAADPAARQATYLIGRLVSMHHRWATDQVRAALARGCDIGTAYRQVTRSFLRILHAMLRDDTDYDEAKYQKSLRDRGVNRAQAA